MGDWVTVVDSHWPWLIIVGVIVLGIPYVIKSLRALKDFLWAPFIAYLKRAGEVERNRLETERQEINSKIADLETQVQHLVEQVAELRYRDRMYWAWVVSDQEWHRRLELMAVEKGWDLPPHISFDDFYDEWNKKHPQPKPQ